MKSHRQGTAAEPSKVKPLNSITKVPDSLFGVPVVKVSEQKAPYVIVQDKERK